MQPGFDVELIVSGACGSDTIATEIKGVSIGENIIENSLEIYPNPTDGVLNVSFNTENSADIFLYISDFSGKLILKEKAMHSNGKYNGQINIEKLENGSYILQIRSDEMNVVKKIIKG